MKESIDEYGVIIIAITFLSMMISIGGSCLLKHCADAMDYMEQNPFTSKKEAWKVTRFNDDNVELFE